MAIQILNSIRECILDAGNASSKFFALNHFQSTQTVMAPYWFIKGLDYHQNYRDSNGPLLVYEGIELIMVGSRKV